MVVYRIVNKYTYYDIEAHDLAEAKATAERHHTHAAKRGWTWTWREDIPGQRWFLDIRNSRGTPMNTRGYGCSLLLRGER